MMANSNENFNETELSIHAIGLFLNNDWEECDKILAKHKDKSPSLHFCYALVSFTKAVMNLEDSGLQRAIKDLDNAQKLCKDYIKNITKKSKQNNGKGVITADDLYEKLSKEIIIADCKLYIALLTILRQDIPSIITLGMFELRRSWKIYSNMQKRLYELLKQLDPNAESVYGTGLNQMPDIKITVSDEAGNFVDIPNEEGEDDEQQVDDFCIINDFQSNGTATAQLAALTITKTELSLEKVKELLASVSFGYGIMQLCFSFLPPSILKLLKFIGFDGDRNAAFQALHFASKSTDLRSPFADITFLIHSIMGKQLFGHSEVELYLEECELQRLLNKNLERYSKSCIFLIQQAKFNEFIKKNLPDALVSFQAAYDNAPNINEIKCIVLYEIGLIHLLNLDYQKSLEYFMQFTKNSKWSNSFNCLLEVLINGSLDNLKLAGQLLKQFSKSSTKKNPIENYALRRIEFLKKNQIKSKVLCQFLLLELVYLWVYLPYAKEDCLSKMIQILDEFTDKGFASIKCLLEAAMQYELKNVDLAEQLFKESIARDEKQSSLSRYVQPYAYLQLSILYTDLGDWNSAVHNINKAKSYKDYDLEDRLQIQMRTLQRRIDHKRSAVTAAN